VPVLLVSFLLFRSTDLSTLVVLGGTFRFNLFVYFCFSLDHFVFVLFAFVVLALGLVSSALSQEIGWEERL